MPNIISRSKRKPTIVRIAKTVAGRTYHSTKWYYRAWSGRRPVYFPLDENVNTARMLAARIRDFIRTGVTSVEEARQRFSAGLLARKVRASVASIGEVLDLLRADSSVLNLQPTSAYAYENSLLLIVETVLRARRHAASRLPEDLVRNQPLTVLDRRMLDDFKRIRVGAATEHNKLRDKSTKRTVNKHLRNSKAVFKQVAVDCYRAQGLVIPDLSEFLATPLYSGVSVEYQLPRADLIRQVATAIIGGALDPNEQMAAMLALHAGLRANEIAHARWSWLNTDEGVTPYLRVQAEDDFDTKNHRARSVPLQGWFVEWLQSRRRAGATFILDGDLGERADDVFRRLAVWLRSGGVAVNKPVHELRKWFGSFAVYSTKSFPRAQKMLGHRSAQTTNDYYADLEFSPMLAEVWTNGPISVAA